ncbi:MAG: NAD-dependent epimerase/dehydratase family protein, partial [Candidatus Tyrphobacter sp.]
MIALVTGAAGFLGSHLVDALLGREYRVIGLDDLSTGSLENLTDAWATGHFIFRACDVSAAIDVANGVDVVFHFASPAGRYDCERLALETLRVNGRGTDLCCQLALRNGARLVYASIPPETNASCEASSVYGEAKRYGESIVGAYARGSGLDARIVRMYDVYGPRLRLSRGGAVSIFIGQALREAAFTIDGDDTQSVALSYVDDVVDAV